MVVKHLRTISDMKRMQETNRVTVLRVLLQQAPMSRVALAKETALSTPTITRIIKELMQENLVVEVGKEESALGRSPILLELAVDRLTIFALEITRRRVEGMAVSLHGDVRGRATVDLSSTDLITVSTACSMIVSRLAQDMQPQTILLGIGISVSGIVSEDHQTVVLSDSLGWKDVAVKALLPAYHPPMLLVENDANAALLGERWLGQAQGQQNAVFISVGDGIGASTVQNGILLTGEQGLAGEIAHLPLVPDGLLCPCGRRGCFEMYVLRRHVQRRYKEQGGQEEDILVGFAKGELVAQQVVWRAAQALAQAIVICALLVNPEHIFIGGNWVEAGEPFLQLVAARVKELYPLHPADAPAVGFSSLYPNAGVMGAAGLVMNEFFAYQW